MRRHVWPRCWYRLPAKMGWSTSYSIVLFGEGTTGASHNRIRVHRCTSSGRWNTDVWFLLGTFQSRSFTGWHHCWPGFETSRPHSGRECHQKTQQIQLWVYVPLQPHVQTGWVSFTLQERSLWHPELRQWMVWTAMPSLLPWLHFYSEKVSAQLSQSDCFLRQGAQHFLPPTRGFR